LSKGLGYHQSQKKYQKKQCAHKKNGFRVLPIKHKIRMQYPSFYLKDKKLGGVLLLKSPFVKNK
jgi:hypothetical protein